MQAFLKLTLAVQNILSLGLRGTCNNVIYSLEEPAGGVQKRTLCELLERTGHDSSDAHVLSKHDLQGTPVLSKHDLQGTRCSTEQQAGWLMLM